MHNFILVVIFAYVTLTFIMFGRCVVFAFISGVLYALPIQCIAYHAKNTHIYLNSSNIRQMWEELKLNCTLVVHSSSSSSFSAIFCSTFPFRFFHFFFFHSFLFSSFLLSFYYLYLQFDTSIVMPAEKFFFIFSLNNMLVWFCWLLEAGEVRKLLLHKVLFPHIYFEFNAEGAFHS